MVAGGARSNPAVGLPFTSAIGIPFANPGSTHWWRVEERRVGQGDPIAGSPPLFFPSPSLPNQAVLF